MLSDLTIYWHVIVISFSFNKDNHQTLSKVIEDTATYSLSSFIYYNDVKTTIQFSENRGSTETESGEHLHIIG